MQTIRTLLCEELSIAEELIPMTTMHRFYFHHESHALLRLQYPQATVHTDTVSPSTIDLYRQTFRGEVMPSSAFACFGRSRALVQAGNVRMARDHACIVLPRAAADANLVAAYVNRACNDIFNLQTWYLK